MIKLYGNEKTSAGRCHFMLAECGLKYETIDLNMMEKKEHKSPEYLKLNPNGKVPTLVDGDFVIWESVAINNYLAEKYKPELLGKNIEQRALTNQWSIWSLCEFQPPLVDMLIQMVFVPEANRDMGLVEKCKAKLPVKLQVLNESLKQKKFILGDTFTISDINLFSVASIGQALQISYHDYPEIKAWMARVQERPSFKSYASRMEK